MCCKVIIVCRWWWAGGALFASHDSISSTQRGTCTQATHPAHVFMVVSEKHRYHFPNWTACAANLFFARCEVAVRLADRVREAWCWSRLATRPQPDDGRAHGGGTPGLLRREWA
jgi:hypothetical protein